MSASPSPSLNPWFPPAAPGTSAPPPLRAIGILGTGAVATGLAHWCAAKGFGVVLCDREPAAVTQAVGLIRELFRGMEQRGEISHDVAHKAMGGIGITTGIEDLEFCDIIIDTMLEDMASKRARFTALAAAMPPDLLLATGVSASSLEEIAAVTTQPGRLLGLQFFEPVGTSPQVQVTIAAGTERVTAERVLAFIAMLGKRALLQGAPRGGA